MLKISVILLLLCAGYHVALSFRDGMMANGGFESGPDPKVESQAIVNMNNVPEWETLGSVEYVKSGQNHGDMLIVVPEGDFALRLGSNSAIKQKVTVEKGKFYSMTFSAARTCGQNILLNVSVSPSSDRNDSGLLPIQTTYSSLGWDFLSWAFVAEANDTVITIHNPSKDEDDMGCGPIIDTIALKLLPYPKRTRFNMVKNGDFEEGPYIIPNTSVGVLIPPKIEDHHSPLRGWMIESLKAVKYIDSDHFYVPEGQRAIELVGGRESSIAQIVRTIPGKAYHFSFLVGDANNTCQGNFEVEAIVGNATVKVPYTSTGTGGFVKANFKFEASSYRTRVRFLSLNYFMKINGSLCGPVIDDVKMIGVRRK